MADATGDDVQRSDDEVSLLARLLGDAELRRRFVHDSRQVARELTDDSSSLEFLLALDHRQLEEQAETLISKRQHEVAQLLPETWQRLGDRSTPLFKDYLAVSVWPEGHNRHLRDAEAFGLWLAGRADSQLIQAEWNRVRFRLSTSRVAFGIVRGGLLRYQIQILFRRSSGQVRELILGVG